MSIFSRAYFIKADRKRRSEPPPTPLRRSSDGFNFQTHCLICGKAVPTAEQRYRHPERDPVSVVATLEISQPLIKSIESRSDTWGEEVNRRIAGTIDLVAAEGRYHRLCYANYLKRRESCEQSDTRHEAFVKLCLFMEAEDDSQFSLQVLQQKMAELSPLVEPYSGTHLIRASRGAMESRS